MKSQADCGDASTVLELQVGDEIIEVRLDDAGIHFCHPWGDASEGYLTWDAALAMSFLPESYRRAMAPAA
jgi:hypothetical protein